MRLNPIVKKDVKVQARSMKMCWGVFAYELILALVFFLAMVIIQEESMSMYSNNNIYSSMVLLYPVLAVTQIVILGVVVPVRTSASISGEKERQTFDIMMTTSMTPFSVVMGKVTTAVVQSMFFVVASMPVMALPFIIGGLSWGYLFWFLAIAFLVSFFAAGIGILCSSICRKSIGAVIMSYVIYLVFFVGTVLPYIIYQITTININTSYSTRGEGLVLFLLANPAVYLAEFFTWVMTGESMVNALWGVSSGWSAPGLTHNGLLQYMIVGHRWMIFSTILFLAVSFLFLWIAARRINPVKARRTRNKKK